MKVVMTIEPATTAGQRPLLVIPALSSALMVTILTLPLSGFTGGAVALWPLIVIIAFVVALAHTMLLGIPYVLLLWKIKHFSILPMLLGGFMIGFIPAAILFWPDVLKAQAAIAAALAGALGAAGAATFHLSCRRLSPADPLRQ